MNHSNIESAAGSKSQKFNEPLKDSSRQRLGKPVGHHLLTGHKVYPNLVSLVQVTDVVVCDINVL